MDLKRLKQLAEAATPGPWTATNDGSIAFGEVKQNTRSHIRIAKGGGWLFETCDPEFKRKADQKFIAAANPQAVLGLIARIESLEKHLALALSFAPKGPVPEGLAPMFYHTLEYHSEVELQKRIDEAREALKEET